MRARRVLALAHLVAARPVGQSKASVVPFSQSSAEFAQARRALTGYVMTDSTIRTAVAAWLADATAAEAKYGHISTWETSGVTDMSYLFRGDTTHAAPLPSPRPHPSYPPARPSLSRPLFPIPTPAYPLLSPPSSIN